MSFFKSKIFAMLVVFLILSLFEVIGHYLLPGMINLIVHVVMIGVVSILIVNGVQANKEKKVL